MSEQPLITALSKSADEFEEVASTIFKYDHETAISMINGGYILLLQALEAIDNRGRFVREIHDLEFMIKAAAQANLESEAKGMHRYTAVTMNIDVNDYNRVDFGCLNLPAAQLCMLTIYHTLIGLLIFINRQPMLRVIK